MVVPEPQLPEALQVSPCVQASPSLQGSPERMVSVHELDPLHSRSIHSVSAQLTGVPVGHSPLASQVSPYVHRSESSQAVPVKGTSVQALDPLQLLVMHWVFSHEIDAPAQTPPPQASLNVQSSPSSQRGSSARHCQVPP